MPRPRHPKPDQNKPVRSLLAEWDVKGDHPHNLRYVCKLRGQVLTFLDISSLPGQTDWIVMSDVGWYLAIEEKQPGNEGNLTGGELEWAETPGIVIVSSPDALKYVILERVNE